MCVALAMAWLVGTALAGSGPWVIGDGGFTLYGGVEAQHFGNLGIVAGGERDVLQVGEGVSTFGVKGIGTVGVGTRAEVELTVPWNRVEVSRDDAEICAIGLDACDKTEGIGILATRIKGLVLDEFFGAPLSLAVGTELRFGELTAANRERITNLGEGTFDAGGFASVGRTGGLGQGYWSAWFEGGYRYRLPTTRHYPQMKGDRAVPGSEFTAALEAIVGPRTSFGLGPSASLLWRPFGIDFGAVDLTDPDRFAALDVVTTRVGGTAVVRTRGVSASASVQRVVFSRNNPTDTVLVSLGVQVDGHLSGNGDG